MSAFVAGEIFFQRELLLARGARELLLLRVYKLVLLHTASLSESLAASFARKSTNVRVRQLDGGMAWSSPWWVGGERIC